MQRVEVPIRKKYTRHKRRHITLPNGKVARPRAEIATEVFGITERTASNHKWPVFYVANVAYCPYDEVLELEASRIRRAPEPRDAKRGRRRR